ncbi:hypothetical protein TanjilG_11037 [Lupinus angustifolius]|uniref:C2 domain-containing protein n=1 Tax=Lupinus angustifolius TaxID=3871 RepID=A0A1J7GTA2_LUPAN|nr:PREDICTED: uncharacterized protein LOC109328526 [Lupinus angustifolius]OIV97513.1 hypothetical protein TanjilG_11037 [Lupinus angustifolius]
MDSSHNLPSLCFELRIIQAKNIECIKSSGNSLFARFYLPTGNNNKIQLNTKKVSSKSMNPFWNESFNLECSCPQEFLETLDQESMVLELRQRKKKIWGSNLIGKGLIPWKKILDSSNMMLKEWVKMDLVNGSDDIIKAPEVQVEIKIRVSSMENEGNNQTKWDKCGCKNSHDLHPWLSAEDYDIFTLGSALEAF